MADLNDKLALIVGAGSGLSVSIARSFAAAGMKIALAARSVGDLGPLAAEIGARTFAADATDREAVKKLYGDLADTLGETPMRSSTTRAIAPVGPSSISIPPRSRNPSR